MGNVNFEAETNLQEDFMLHYHGLVFSRLMAICLEYYQCAKTELNFDEWMEHRGLIKEGGVFSPVEYYIPKSKQS